MFYDVFHQLQQLLDVHLKGQGDGPGGGGVSEEVESMKDEVDRGDHWSYPKSAEEICRYDSGVMVSGIAGVPD